MFIHHFLKIHYLSGAILIQTTGVADSLYYSYSDSQGSLIALVHEGGSIIQRFAYDPWGARRDPNNWTAKDSRTSFIINRGYTGHEHLSVFGLINMNARLYDPAVGRFLSPDSYVQSPDNSQSFNRYSYCLNNPLKYSDPTGLLTWNDVIAGFAFIAGVALEFVPEMQWLGTPLIAAGFSHFAYTIDQMQNSNSSWNQASNVAGINFSGSINFNGPTQKEKNYANSHVTFSPNEEKTENSFERDLKVNNSRGNNDLLNIEMNYSGVTGLTKNKYSAFDEMRGDRKWGGMEIDLSYISMYSNGSRWMQYWMSDFTPGVVIKTGLDAPDTNNGDYYTPKQLQIQTNGNSISFDDRPASYLTNDFPSTFTKFSLILVNKYNQMILKLYYGYFTNKNGTTAFPLTVGYHKY